MSFSVSRNKIVYAVICSIFVFHAAHGNKISLPLRTVVDFIKIRYIGDNSADIPAVFEICLFEKYDIQHIYTVRRYFFRRINKGELTGISGFI